MDAMYQKWLAPAQAARAMGVTPARVRQLMVAGRLKYERTVLGRIIDPESVETAIAERRQRRGTRAAA